LASRPALAIRGNVSHAESSAAPTNLRILHVIPQADGAQSDFTFAKRQVSSLERVGVTNDVFYLYPANRLLPQWRRLRQKARMFHPHLIHAHYGTVTAFLCGLGIGVPLVVTFRGSDLNPDTSVGRLRFRVSRFLSEVAALRSRAIICVTDELRSRLWLGRTKATVSSGGIDLEHYRPLPRDEARRRLNWSLTTKVVLFNAGRNAVIKRADIALEAVEIARKIVPDLRIEMMRGEVDPEKVPLLLSASDCLLVTSDSEGSPYIVKEALACNLPIVSVAVGDIPDRLAKVTPSRIVEREVTQLGEAIAEVVLSVRRSNGRDTIADISERAEVERLCQVYRYAVGAP